jgi:hypothetical protein
MANPAAVDDLVSRWRTLTAQETTNGTTFLADAWGLLKRIYLRRGEDLDALVATDDDGFADEVVRILATAVLRVMKNPDGKRQESIDDYSWTRDESVSSGLLYFTDDELDGLIPGSGVTGRAFSIDPLAGRDWPDVS